MLKNCKLCPGNCGVNRIMGQEGLCGETAQVRLARAALHMWEEPCITGSGGSGTVFFSGCTLHCVFCQNAPIAGSSVGKEVSMERLAEIFLELQEKGAENINLVTADHYVPQVVLSLKRAKNQGLTLPVVYNTSSYVKVETLKMLEGLADVYLPDFKFYEASSAYRYTKRKNYPDVAKAAIKEMVRQTGKPEFTHKIRNVTIDAGAYNEIEEPKDILMTKGTIVRHLLLPEGVEEGKKVVRYLLDTYGTEIYISIMNQYTPMGIFADMPELNRQVTEREYQALLDFALDCGIENGFVQETGTARESFIPAFDCEGV